MRRREIVLPAATSALVAAALVIGPRVLAQPQHDQHGQERHGAQPGQAGHDGQAELQFKGEAYDLGNDAPRVGELIADVGYTDFSGNVGSLAEAMGETGLVVVMRDVGCPVSRRYGPRLARLEKEYGAKGFGFLYLNVNQHDTNETVAEEIEAYGFAAPYVFDPQSPIGHELAALTSAEVFVLDTARTLVYRGAVDDQYGIGFAKFEPTKNYLLDALDAVVEGDRPVVGATMAPGCYLSLVEPPRGR